MAVSSTSHEGVLLKSFHSRVSSRFVMNFAAVQGGNDTAALNLNYWLDWTWLCRTLPETTVLRLVAYHSHGLGDVCRDLHYAVCQ